MEGQQASLWSQLFQQRWRWSLCYSHAQSTRSKYSKHYKYLSHHKISHSTNIEVLKKASLLLCQSYLISFKFYCVLEIISIIILDFYIGLASVNFHHVWFLNNIKWLRCCFFPSDEDASSADTFCLTRFGEYVRYSLLLFIQVRGTIIAIASCIAQVCCCCKFSWLQRGQVTTNNAYWNLNGFWSSCCEIVQLSTSGLCDCVAIGCFFVFAFWNERILQEWNWSSG